MMGDVWMSLPEMHIRFYLKKRLCFLPLVWGDAEPRDYDFHFVFDRLSVASDQGQSHHVVFICSDEGQMQLLPFSLVLFRLRSALCHRGATWSSKGTPERSFTRSSTVSLNKVMPFVNTSLFTLSSEMSIVNLLLLTMEHIGWLQFWGGKRMLQTALLHKSGYKLTAFWKSWDMPRILSSVPYLS